MEKCSDIQETNDGFFFKYLLLTCVRKITEFLDGEQLSINICPASFANFVSKTLDSKDIIHVALGILIVQKVIVKIPSVTKMLAREGIQKSLERLMQPTYVQTLKIVEEVKKQPESKDKNLFDPALAKKLFSGNLSKKEDIDDFMKQLIDWKNDPKKLLESLKQMKEEESELKDQKNEDVKVGKERPKDEDDEEQEQDELDNLRKKELIAKQALLEQQQLPDLLNSLSLSENEILIGGSETQGLFGEKVTPPENRTNLDSKNAAILDFNNMELSISEKTDLNQIDHKPEIASLDQEPQILTSAAPIDPVKPPEPKKYSLKDAREDVSRLAEETLELIDKDVIKASLELVRIQEISEKLKQNDLSSLKDLSNFFSEDLKMTFYEFSSSEIIPNLLEFLIKSEVSEEEKAQRLSAYYNSFYINKAVPIKKFYENLKEFITRLPEIKPGMATETSEILQPTLELDRNISSSAVKNTNQA